MKHTSILFLILLILLPLQPAQSFQGTGLEGTLAYSIVAEDGSFKIRLLDLATQEATELTDGFYPHLSPDGTKIMYMAKTSPDKTDIYMMDIEEGIPIKLTNEDFLSPISTPFSWSPNSEYLLFGTSDFSPTNTITKLYSVRVADSTVKQLPLDGSPPVLGAKWTPDNQLMLNFADGLTVMNWDGSKQEIILELPNTTGIFALNTAGTQGVFIENTFAQTMLLVDLADEASQVLTDIPTGSGISQMDFAPNAEFVALITYANNAYIVNVTTLEWQWIGAEVNVLDWSPDGKYLIVNRLVDGLTQVFAEPTDRTQPAIQLTLDGGSQGNW